MDQFDAYHKWLGIPPVEQPPNYYRLLGLTLFEADPDVIDAAANRQMAYLQQCASGSQVALSQKILNEVAAARVCLLNATKKKDYDADLRAKLAPPPAAKPKRPAMILKAEPELDLELFSQLSQPSSEARTFRSLSRLPMAGVAFTAIVAAYLGYRFLWNSPETNPESDEPTAVAESVNQPGNHDNEGQAATSRKSGSDSAKKSLKTASTRADDVAANSENRSKTPPQSDSAAASASPPKSSLTEYENHPGVPSSNQLAGSETSSSQPATPSTVPTPGSPPKKKESSNASQPKTPARPKYVLADSIFWKGNWYWFSPNQVSFVDAGKHATSMKGRLVVISSPQENEFVTSHVSGPTWIGIQRVKKVWLNAFGQRATYFNWDAKQPSGFSDENFAATHKTGKWHDYAAATLFYCVEWGDE